MKPFSNLLHTAAFLCLCAGPANAATECAYLELAAQAGAVNAIGFTTLQHSESRRLYMLRNAAVLSGSLTTAQAKAADFAYLAARFNPIFHTQVIGKVVFQSANLSLGDNPYVYLFNFDGRYSGIESRDGTAYVDGEFCDVPPDLLK